MGSAATRTKQITRGLALLMIGASVASAKPPEEIKEPKDVAAALLMISSDEFAKREVATDYLLKAPADAVTQVEKRLENEKDPETIERLSRVAQHLFMKEQTGFEGKAGFMGIAFNIDYETRGKYGDEIRPVIVVSEMLPGFPSVEFLKPGDRIVGLDGTEFPSEFRDTDFRFIISNKKPGTKVTLMVERGKEKINASIPLAGIKDADVISTNDFRSSRELKAATYLANIKHAGDKPINIPVDDIEDITKIPSTFQWVPKTGNQ